MMPYTFHSPAKLNLFLHIVGRRQDGYHELQTLFQLLDYHDELHFEINTTGEIDLMLFNSPLPNPPPQGGREQEQDPFPSSGRGKDGMGRAEDNLILKAAHLLKKTCRSPLGCTVSLCKKIPIGGGLGGGSSNAATTLLVLNWLWRLNLPKTTLAQLGLQLGADVPLFVLGHSSFAEGIGEMLIPIELPKRWYLVLTPHCTVSTQAIFSHQKLTRDSERLTIRAFDEAVLGMQRNDCTPVVTELYPPVQEALCWLLRYGDARLTGTGACVFLAFPTQEAARRVLQLVRLPMQGFVAEGLNMSPLHQQLEAMLT